MGGKPQLIIHTKKRGIAAFFYFIVNSWNCVRGPCFKRLLKKPIENPHAPFFRRKVCHRTFLIRKVSKRISRRTHHFTLAKAFKDSQETFLEKFLVLGFGAKAPTDNAEANSTAPRAVSLYKQKTSRHMSACRVFD